MEEWRPIPGYEGLYDISNLGRVRSNFYHKTPKQRIIKQCIASNGYLMVNLRDADNIVSFKTVHRLLARVFIPNHRNEILIDHINRNRLDNRLCNLRWVSPSENRQNTTPRTDKASAQNTIDVSSDSDTHTESQ